MVSPELLNYITAEKANLREGPGKDHPVLWALGRRYPLRVEEVKDDYLKVKDYEGDSGWVHKSLVDFEPYVIVKNAEANVRKGPGVDNPIVFKSLRGVILKVKGEKNNWLEIKHQDGDEGWISRNLVWGYKDE